jgi:hypothetical protein
VAWLPPDAGEPAIREAVLAARSAAMPGRFFVALWQVPLAWGCEVPVEAIALEAAMGAPEDRREDASAAVSLLANLVIRSYGDDPLVPRKCFQALVLRRAGDSPIVRRRAGGAPEAAAKLDTRRAAFTRDWANNTWHVRDDDAPGRIVARLSRLLRWPDEEMLVQGMAWRERGAPEGDLVGVPERYGAGTGMEQRNERGG